MDKALLYVSRRLVPYPDVDGAIRNIIAVSRVRNARLDVTGALIATPAAFAQLLEGPAGSVDAVMESITRDARHCAVRVLAHALATERRFERWTMAYWGPSTFVAGYVEPLAASTEAPEADGAAVQRLLSLMDAFRKGDGADPKHSA